MDRLIQGMLSHLQHIQRSRKGGMGAPNNIYLPQLRVDLVDELAERVSARLVEPSVDVISPGEERDGQNGDSHCG